MKPNTKEWILKTLKIDLIISLISSVILTGLGLLPQIGRLNSKLIYLLFPSYQFAYSLISNPFTVNVSITKLFFLNLLFGFIYILIWALIISSMIYIIKNLKVKENNQSFLQFTWKKFFVTLSLGVIIFIYILFASTIKDGGGPSILTIIIGSFGLWPFLVVSKVSQNFPLGYAAISYTLATMVIIFQFYLIPCVASLIYRKTKK